MSRRHSKSTPNPRAAGKSPAVDVSRPREDRWDCLWLAAFLLLAFLVGCVEIEDGDIWWHLRTGQLIFERGEVPRTDWFTYTNPESPWIDLHWGFQLIAAALWAVGGAPALVLAKSCLGTVTFALCLGCRRPEWPWRRVVACWLPSILIFSGRNQVRPEMFSLLFLAGTLAVLFHQDRRPWLVWLLPLIQVLWINIHALFILGLVVWFCFLADAVMRIVARRFIVAKHAPPPTAVEIRRWAIVTFLVLAAALVNPYGFEGAMFPRTLLERIQGDQRGFYQAFAGEFNGLGDFIGANGLWAAFTNLTTCMLLALFVLGLATFGRLVASRRFNLFRALLFAIFAYLAWQASRNSALFALVGGWVVHTNLGELLEGRKSAASATFRGGRVTLATVLGFLLLAVPTNILWFRRPSVNPRLFGLGEVPGVFAHDAARFLSLDGMPRRVYADDFDQAAVYPFHNGPERKVFADGRLEVNTPETLSRYRQIERQFVNRDPGVLENLTHGIPPDVEGKPEVPALLFDVRVFIKIPGLLAGLRADNRFQAVYGGYDKIAVVFLDRSQAQRLGLPPVSNEVLQNLEEAIQQSMVNRRADGP